MNPHRKQRRGFAFIAFVAGLAFVAAGVQKADANRRAREALALEICAAIAQAHADELAARDAAEYRAREEARRRFVGPPVIPAEPVPMASPVLDTY